MNLISTGFLLLVAVALASADEYESFRTPMSFVSFNSSNYNGKISGQIIAGNFATLGMFPWQAGILFQKNGFISMCGGTLIHPRWILTAAHCTNGALRAEVRLGNLTFYPGPAYYVNTTDSFITHPLYNFPYNLNNDIGLIRLPVAANLSDTVKVIQFAPRNLQFRELFISGWGKTCNNCSGAELLKYAAVNAINNTDCAKTYGINAISNNHVCTRGTPNQSPCQGDSGGPLTQNGTTPYLVGVISFVSANGCENPNNSPAAYIRPINYCSWIEGYTGSLCPADLVITPTTNGPSTNNPSNPPVPTTPPTSSGPPSESPTGPNGNNTGPPTGPDGSTIIIPSTGPNGNTTGPPSGPPSGSSTGNPTDTTTSTGTSSKPTEKPNVPTTTGPVTKTTTTKRTPTKKTTTKRTTTTRRPTTKKTTTKKASG